MSCLNTQFSVYRPGKLQAQSRHKNTRGRGVHLLRSSVALAVFLVFGGLAKAQSALESPGDPTVVKATSTSGKTPGGLIRLSNESFQFGTAIVGFPMVKTVAVVTNNTNWTVPLQFRITGDPGYSVVGDSGCGSSLVHGASCNLLVRYAPQSASMPKNQKATLLVASIDKNRSSFFDLTLTGISGAMTAGVVGPSKNSMVAQYAMTLPFEGTWKVSFGKTTDYGFDTNVVSSPTAGVPTSLYVAGMQANTVYHMRASVTLTNGATATDVDHTFTTGALPPGIIPKMIVTTTPGLTPQPGVELITPIFGSVPTSAIVTDLAGNVIWTYAVPDIQGNTFIEPIQPLTNGHFIMLLSANSQIASSADWNWLNTLREIDLAGNTVRELPMSELNTRLHTAGYANLHIELYSHEVIELPSGHILVMANTFRPFTDLPGHPGVTNMLGDVVVDLDQNFQPVWVWNEFDHFDINRHPMGFTDWTHSNAITYSPDDGNFLVSIRHQNWVVKVNYNHGEGDGSTIWKLGYQGDFALKGGTEPQDWFYAQHNPHFISTNSTGVFSLGLMDNGDDRGFPDGTNCLTQLSRCYTTVPVYTVDEAAKTATVTWRQTLTPDLYSSFAGNMRSLPDGNVEYNLAGVYSSSHIFEVTSDAVPATVWHMYLPSTSTYRAFRMPSLYPGVQW